MYSYDRRIAALEPTVESFLMILSANMIQADAAQRKRDMKRGQPGNPYALGHMMEAVGKVRSAMQSVLKSSEPEDLKKLKDVIVRNFTDFGARKKTLKTIDDYLTSGKVPKYPVGGGKPIWKAAGEY